MLIDKFTYFYPERPRLIHIDQPLFQELDNDPAYVAELKYNETRLQLHYYQGKFQFWNRHGKQLEYEPDARLRSALRNRLGGVQGYCLFDGGLRHNRVVGVRNKIVLWDTFIWNGALLISKPHWVRRNILREFLDVEGEPLGITKEYLTDFRKVYDDHICHDEIEGLVIKKTTGMLQLGRNNNIDSDWMFKVRKPSGRYQF